MSERDQNATPLIPVHDPSEIPEFDSIAERAAFWETHEITGELWDKLEPAENDAADS